MKILKLEWRNIFSYGDDITSIEFDKNGKLWQLSGRSGSGKSSLLTIPKLLFFGKTEGSDGKPITASDIANRLNKKGWIRGTILKGSDIYIIERTFSPSGLNVYKNEECLDRAGIKNIQNIIETEILDELPYHIFSNVMTLSLNNFKSFISMSPGDKRMIIDKIFSLEIINKVHELIKKDMKELGNSINNSNSQIYSLEQTIKTSQNELHKISVNDTEVFKQEMCDIEDKLKKISGLFETQTDLYKQYYSKYSDILSAINQLRQLISQVTVELNESNKQLALFKEDKCPICGTSFQSERFDDVRNKLELEIEERNNMILDYNSKISQLNVAQSEITSKMNEVSVNLQKISDKNYELNVRYKTLESTLNNNNEFSSIKNIIDSTNESKLKLEKCITESNDKMKLLEVMENLYSVDGIKQTMMNNYIPSLNAEIEETLKFLGFPYTLTFDNNFDPHLQDLSKDIKPQSLSTGEHKKVDLTVLCSLLKMIKRKYPQINLVCLDEAVSSLDYESSSEIIKYLKEISVDMDLNIFVVSHTQLDENLFDEHLFVEKQAEYSILTRL